MSERVDRPVFVVGTGRCGLSLVVELLATHEDMAWFSQWSKHYPGSRWAPKAPHLLTRPGIRQMLALAEKITRVNLLPRPREAYTCFDLHFRGFGLHYRPLTPDDVHQSAREGLRNVVRDHVLGQRKRRFICELSGRARIAFLREIFPDAKFIHVVRDPRPTVNSWLNVDYWLGWRGEWQWRWGPIPDPYRPFVYNDRPCFAAMAAVQYNMLMDNFMEESAVLDEETFTRVRFEDVVRNPEPEVRRLSTFVGLEYTNRFDGAWRRLTIHDPNTRRVRIPPWRENLNPQQQETITRICEKYVERFNYSAA